MKNILLIIFNPILDSNILQDRIRTLGSSFVFWDNHCFVETELDPKQVYERISAEPYGLSLMIVMKMSQEHISYYGRMNTELWEWLKIHKT